MPVHDRSSFENLYAGQPRWEIGRPQTALFAVADRIAGAVLDAGCGMGENALFFAGRGQTVTGSTSWSSRTIPGGGSSRDDPPPPGKK